MINMKLFVKRIRNMLWPDCKWFKTMEQQEDDVLLLKRMHQEEQDGDKEQVDISNSNLPNVFAIVETSQNYYLFASYRGATLQDLITYNPGVLSSNLKKGFVIYQLLRVVASFHSRGILHGR
jgi:serine/threonine protein kinase